MIGRAVLGGAALAAVVALGGAPAPAASRDDGERRLRIAQLDAPKRFWCLRSLPRQAQVTIGWSVPAATAVRVELDGRPLPEGIRRRPPFHVLAGPPSGIGTTVVFGCRSGRRHTIRIRWSRPGSADRAVRRTIAVRKAPGR